MDSSLLLLASAFALVLPAELPDKTMVATLLLSARYRPAPVLLGASAAFAVQCVLAVAFGSVLALLPRRVVALVACLMFTAGALLLLRSSRSGGDEGADVTADLTSWWRIAALSFGVLFTAEWGDASQLATAALTARFGDPVAVGLGGWLALVTVATLAVLAGRGFALRLPIRWVQRIAGTIFAAFAVVAGLAAVLG